MYNEQGLEEVKQLSNAHYRVLKDRTDWGLTYHRLRKPGVGILRNVVHQNPGAEAPSRASFIDRTDLPKGTVLFAPDFGEYGSRWKYTGPVTGNAKGWDLDRRFFLIDKVGSFAFPVGATGSAQAGVFKELGAGLDLPAYFWTKGRRIHVRFEAIHNLSHITPTTQIRIGGVTVLSIPWTAAMREQSVDVMIWVANTTGADANTLTTSGLMTPNGSATTVTTTDYAVSGLSTTQTHFAIGMADSVTESDTLTVTNLHVEVLH